MAILAANLFFGINFSAVQHITTGFVKPFALNFLRVAVSVALFWLLLLLYPQPAGIRKKDLPRFLLCALTGVVINQLLFIKGLSMTYSIHASILVLVTPIFISLVAVWMNKERSSSGKIAGLALGIAGATILVAGKELQGTASNPFLGNIYIIVNSVSYAFYFALVKPLMITYRPLHVLRWVFTLGLPFMALAGWSETTTVIWTDFGSVEWSALAFVILGATFFAYLFNLYGISKLGPSITGTYIYTQPIFASIIAIFFLGESLQLFKMVAAACIIIGVWLVGRDSGSVTRPVKE